MKPLLFQAGATAHWPAAGTPRSCKRSLAAQMWTTTDSRATRPHKDGDLTARPPKRRRTAEDFPGGPSRALITRQKVRLGCTPRPGCSEQLGRDLSLRQGGQHGSPHLLDGPGRPHLHCYRQNCHGSSHTRNLAPTPIAQPRHLAIGHPYRNAGELNEKGEPPSVSPLAVFPRTPTLAATCVPSELVRLGARRASLEGDCS